MWHIVFAVSALATLACAGCVELSLFAPPEIETVELESSPVWIETERIAVIDVSGFITSSDLGSTLLRFQTSAADIRERLDRVADDWRVKAIILRIDSPGGEATGSDVIYQQIKAFRKKKEIPVVACLTNLAASGGYYVACACDRIVAYPTAITGSVGTIMHFYNVQGLFEKVGLKRITIKSGEKKDIASSVRPMTPEEREILEGITHDLSERFFDVVRTGRPDMKEEHLRLIRDGRVVLGKMALEMGMVDKLGFLEDAIDEAKKLAGVETADVIAYRSGERVNTNLYAGTQTDVSSGNAIDVLGEALQTFARQCAPGFYYLWLPQP